MSYQDDLDWLARNVHEWKEGKIECIPMSPYKVENVVWSSMSPCEGWITKDQWLARRAELQNKPTEWPVVMAGTGMSIGEWAAKYSGKTPSAQIREAVLNEALRILRDHPDHLSANELADLHDLCDTELTKRDAAVCGDQKYLDATWHERGDLPPVGAECVIWSDGKFPPAECKIEVYSNEQVCVRWKENGLLDVIDMQFSNPGECQFRPIRTERDEAIEAMKALCPYPGSWETTYRLFAESLYDAGYRAGCSE